jgi:hypothetical protein
LGRVLFQLTTKDHMFSLVHRDPPASPCLAASLSRALAALVAGFLFLQAIPASADFNSVVFEDDFSSGVIDPAKYVPDAPFFEGGVGDIHAEAGDGVLRFVGTTSAQWWAGGTLRVVPTFTATEQSKVAFSIDRVAEAGVGTASRSALWIFDETQTKYVLFADVRAEGGWRFNRKIGEDGDVPTGSGTDIAAFNGGSFDDAGLHRMSIVADGKTVKLLLDGVEGAEVKFPFSKVLFHIGSYARANNDTANTTWDNLQVQTIREGKLVFSDDFGSGAIDPAKFQPDAPFFEGGTGDIHAEAADGVLRFVGTTSVQWWSGGTLRVVPTFTATEQTPVQITLDRVSEAGVGTASRSALWILDESKTKYVLFADVRAEGGWRFNRKIGEDGDVPTGSGTDIALFNGGTYDDGGLHQMSILADGKTVKLLLDGVVGQEVKFPFSKISFQFGAYARANNDTANTTFDNIKVETLTPTTTRVFEDDFSAGAIEPSRYVPDAPFFEGGVGDIHAEASGGAIRFVGSTSQQWWSGGTLRLVPTFEASDEATVTLTIDRVAEAGIGTASRSALWILNETRDKYVLFADVRAEGGWRFNRKIGEDGDVPTGSGTDIVAFNGGNFDNGGLHQMGMIADGKTVKLLLNGVQGAEVKFPFSPVVFEFGSYARANNDTADTTWDNLIIETTGGAGFSPSETGVRVGALSAPITVRIPTGLNAQKAITLKVVSSDPSAAIPDGGVAGSLDLVFPAGGGNTATFRARGVGLGAAAFSIEGDLLSPNPLKVTVVGGPGTVLDEDFAEASLNLTRWQVVDRGFEASGTGTFAVSQVDSLLDISGSTDSDYWPGASIRTVQSFTANKDLNLVFDVDRVLLEQVGTAGRSGVYITTADRSKYVFFAQNVGENNWEVNVNPGNPEGSGTTLTAFAGVTDTGGHRMRLVANGSTVQVFLDEVFGGSFPFEVNSGIHFELGAYSRAVGDTVHVQYDSAKVQQVLPCITLDPQLVTMTQSEANKQVTVTIPQLLNDIASATVTVTSRDKTVAVPNGSASGSVVLNFAAGTANSQTFVVAGVGKGTTVFDITSSPGACVNASLAVEVVADPQVLVADTFSGTEFDTGLWVLDNTPFGTGSPREETSAITVENGMVKINVDALSATWPGLGLFTAQSYSASLTAPLTFEIDRVLHDFVLVTGTGAQQRTGIWVKDGAGHSILFADNVAHDGDNYGWRYNRVIEAEDDNAGGEGINIAAFDGPGFNDQKSARMKIVVNGATAKLFLNGILGAEIPFPYASGLTFGFGAYVAAATDIVTGYFDNARLLGGEAQVLRVSAKPVAAGVEIGWTGGTLQSSESLSPANWVDVTPAPAGNTLTVNPAQAAKRFYRVRQ